MANKKKVLMLCDHPLATSGVATQARWLINGLLATGRYSFRVFGGAVKHDNYDTIAVDNNPDFIIKPTNGFGDKHMLRQVLAQEKPDVLLLFTDPRFFLWVWEIEDEVHQVCPIAYNHLWDNPPWPEFNRVLYESTDLINCINYPTYEMVHERFPKKTNYVPHAVPSEVFFPMNATERLRHKSNIIGKQRSDHFIVTFVSRNARRKCPNDIIAGFKLFLDELKKTHGHSKATLVMHTDPMDPEGPNLHHTIDLFNVKDNVLFSKDRIGFNEMNSLYNLSDVVINMSLNEGFGLSALEAKMAGRPVIAIKTGGLTRQVQDHETNEQYGVALDPEVKLLVGNQLVPYIYEDMVSHETIAKAMMKMYELSPEEKEKLGTRCREHAVKNYSMSSLITTWDETLSKLTSTWKNEHERWNVVSL